jgi:hypothetical protein
MKIIYIIFFFIACFSIYGQEIEKDKIYFVSKDITKGTFQIEVLNEKNRNINLTSELYEIVEKNRHETDFVYIKINENSRLKIYPRNLITSKLKEELDLYSIVTEFKN